MFLNPILSFLGTLEAFSLPGLLMHFVHDTHYAGSSGGPYDPRRLVFFKIIFSSCFFDFAAVEFLFLKSLWIRY